MNEMGDCSQTPYAKGILSLCLNCSYLSHCKIIANLKFRLQVFQNFFKTGHLIEQKTL